MLEKILRQFDPFQAMSPAELSTVARHAQTLNLPARRWLLRQGRRLKGSYYLVQGRVRLFSPERDISHQSAAARRPIYPGCEAICTRSPARLLHVDTAAIAFLLATAQAGAGEPPEPWQRRFLRSPLLQRLDAGVWQQLVSALEERRFDAGEFLVREGRPAHDFFVLKEGRAGVRRRDETLAELIPGDFFGEDALIMDARRNATVVALERGAVLRLPKDRFAALLVDNLVRFVHSAGEGVRIDLGADWPLARLREALGELDPKRRYHVVGGALRERALAAFILTQKGLDAWPVEAGPG